MPALPFPRLPFPARLRPFLPALACGLGIACFSVMDALMKQSSLSAGVFTAVFWRTAIGTAIATPLWLTSGKARWPGRGMLALHGLRTLAVAGMVLLFFWGLVRTPMAVGMALSFIAPLIALLLAALFLGEPVTRRALAASALGLAGVVVIGAGRLGAGPTRGDSLAGMVAILGSAVLYAVNLVIQRHQAQQVSGREIVFFQNALFVVALLPAVPFFGHLPHGHIWLLIALAACLALTSILLLSWGWARAEAHRLLPVEYSAFLWSALMGRWWFGEALGLPTLAGVVLIVAGCWIGASAGAGEEGPPHIEQTAL
ncbi:MAG TPA: DMT family transporter [Novosphingobium sp.]|nr:DMT family transporter [Novosphingobium sp.]HZV08122.1 DMT family transporter [Novosphingobium sp.]